MSQATLFLWLIKFSKNLIPSNVAVAEPHPRLLWEHIQPGIATRFGPEAKYPGSGSGSGYFEVPRYLLIQRRVLYAGTRAPSDPIYIPGTYPST
jgi:hypothetical protein